MIKPLGQPVVSGRERGQQKAAEKELFKKRCKADAKEKQQPGCAGLFEYLLDGRIRGAGDEDNVQHRQHIAQKAGADQSPSVTQRASAVPLHPGKETLVPDEWQRKVGRGKCAEIEQGFAAESVVDVAYRSLKGCDMEKMKVNSDAQNHYRYEQAQHQIYRQQRNMTKMRNARWRRRSLKDVGK